MKDIAIIMPTYKAHKTIKRTLASMVNQMGPSYRIYISVDGEQEGSYDYLLTMFDMLDIKILYSPINRGCGGARQYGIDNSVEPFFTFIDTDDIFNSINSLSILHRSFEDQDVLVCTPFWRQMLDGTFALKNVSILTWMHGKMYRRSFIDKHGIRFNTEYTNSNEDVGFNLQIGLISDSITERIKQLNDQAVYIQLDNSDSLTRKNNGEFLYKSNVTGYIMNKIHAYKYVIETVKMIDKDIRESIIKALANIFDNYFGRFLDNEEFIKTFHDFSKIFYKEVYHYTDEIDEARREVIEREILYTDKSYGDFIKWKETLK